MCACRSFPSLSNPSGSSTQRYKICFCRTGPRADLIALVTKQQYRWSWTQSAGWPASLMVILTLFVWPFQWSRPLEELKNASSPRWRLRNAEWLGPSIRLSIRMHRLSNGSSSQGKSLPFTDWLKRNRFLNSDQIQWERRNWGWLLFIALRIIKHLLLHLLAVRFLYRQIN